MNAAARRRFEEHREHLASHERSLALSIDEDDEDAYIVGELPVPVGAGITRQFNIRIVYVGLSPFKLLATYEIGQALPRIPDRHIGADGQMCLWLSTTAPADFGTADGLELHLDRVREFFLLQVMYDDNVRRGRTPPWPGPQWAHNAEGYRQWVREQVDDMSPEVIRRLTIASHTGRHRGSRCPCGSGLALGKCHRRWIAMVGHAMRTCPGVADELLILAKVRDVPA